MNETPKLSPAMVKALEVTGLDDIMAGGPTRAALMRRGLVYKREGSGRFGYFTNAGRELAAGLQAKRKREETAALPNLGGSTTLPDPTVTGPCQMQATFMCTAEAVGEHLIPQSMLPDSLIPGPIYALMCLPCKEHLSDAYITELHRGGAS